MGPRIDLVGRVFSSLTVLEELPRRFTPKGVSIRFFKTRCQCGTEGESSYANLTGGLVRSCGCVRTPRAEEYGEALTSTEAFKRWLSIKTRVQRKVRKRGYEHVELAPEWMDFRAFFRDMGECPAGLTIERLDNAKGYQPGNCTWATSDQQMNNQNKSVRLLIDGKWITTREACAVLGLTLGQVQARAVKGEIVKKKLTELVAA